jgi:hypothetical protein
VEIEIGQESASPSRSEEELVPLVDEDDGKSSILSRLRQKKVDLASLVQGLDWESLAIVVCLSTAYLLCNASYSIISPFFPNEASSSIRHVGGVRIFEV